MKKTTLILLISIVSFHLAFGQLNQKIYFDEELNYVIREKAVYYRITEKAPQDSSLFIQKTYYISDTLKSKAICLDMNCQKKEGMYIAYYPSGCKEMVNQYINNEIVNTTKWYENCQIWEVTEQNNSKDLASFLKNKLNSYWSENGEQWVENGYGKVTYYHEDTTTVDSFGEFKDGFKVGLWKGFHESGNPNYEENYTDDKINGISWNEEGESFKYDQLEIQPAPKNGLQEYYNYIGKNLIYPKLARRNNVEGRVYVQFVVDKNGQLIDVKTIKGIGSGCDQEAERVVKNSPFWEIGYMRGQASKFRFILPFTFKLS